MKLKEERKPYFFSTSINCRHLATPDAPSTSCVSTNANFFPSGQPGQSSGRRSDPGSIGQTARTCSRFRRVSQPRMASRSRAGTSGLMP